MEKEIKHLQDIVNRSYNIVFFGGAGFQQKAGSLISGAKTGCITSNMIIRLRKF